MSNRPITNSALLAKVETTVGVDAAPVAADAQSPIEPSFPSIEAVFRQEPRRLMRPNLAVFAPRPSRGLRGTLERQFEVLGTRNGLAYSASNLPVCDPYLVAAGLKRTVDTTAGDESVTYTPENMVSQLGALTEYVFIDGELHKLVGTRADVTLQFEAGQPLLLSVNRTGVYTAPAGVVSMPTITLVDPDAILCEDVGLTITPQGVRAFGAGVIRSFEMVTGNERATRPNANAVGGLAPDAMVSRAPRFTVVLEAPTVDSANFYNMRDAGTPVALEWQAGTSPYAVVGFRAPSARIETATLSVENGIVMITLEGGLYRSAIGTADEFAIRFLARAGGAPL
jgi:hypothetical protein